ncbi:MAG: 30S ribosomal protein S16 [Bacteroidetes bacterium]|nr:30S ribosomal protein S16 [Bacteroidota bacterium]
MATKIRLQRHGRKGQPFYQIVVADARAKRDGKYIERLGYYNPTTVPATIELNADQALHWVLKGATPTDTALAILKFKGVMYKKHLMRGLEKGALTEEQVEQKFNEWIETKEARAHDKRESASKVALDKIKSSVEAGKEKAAAQLKKRNEPEVVEVEEAEEAVAEAEEALAEATEDITEAQEELAEAKEEVAEATEELEEAAEEVIDAEKELVEAKEELAEAETPEEVKEALEEVEEASEEVAEAKEELEEAIEEIAEAQEEVAEAKEEIEEAAEEAEEALEQLADAEETLEEAKEADEEGKEEKA